ncbi:MAG: multiheme c-type cytochrome [Pirellulales bacterium]
MLYQLPHNRWLRWISRCLLVACSALAVGCSKSPTSSRPVSAKPSHAGSANESQSKSAQTASGERSLLIPTVVAKPVTNAADQPVSVQSSTAQKRADAQNADGTYGKDHVDPEKLNGPIFEKWPKPKVALLFSGAQDGYIEPCGCAGLENQKGGLSRRHQLIKRMQADGWPVASFDAGGLVKRYGRQQELKFAAAVEALKTMNYGAVTFGGADLRLSLTELISAVTSVEENKPSPFVATNAALVSFDDPLVARHQIVEAGGMRFGVLAVIGQQDQRQVNNPEVQFKPAANAIAETLPIVQKQRPDKLILLAHSTLKEATELAEKFGQFDYVVTTGGADEPPAQAKKIGKRTQLIEVGHKGMYCVVLGLYDDRQTPQRYQRVPLDARFGESADMQQVMVSYQDQLQALGLAGLNLVPPTGLPKHTQGQNFIGSATCGECHTKAMAVWEKTPHAHATETIVKLSPPRHYDPECLSCHVTGWDPQGYFPFASGYLELKQKHLHSNGCENCHGPGARHAAAQLGEIDVTDKELKALQLSMRVTKEEAKKNLCVQCHDQDNSPDYAWDTYWPQVEHKGKD